MPIETTPFTYSDLNSDPRRETAKVIDEDSIFQSIENYLNTKRRERLFRPDFYGNVEDWLWELAVDNTNAFALLSKVMTDLPRFDPRIQLVASRSSIIAEPDEHRYLVNLTLRIVGFPDSEVVYDAYLIRPDNTTR